MYSNDMVMSKSGEKRGGAESSVRMSPLHPKVAVSFRLGSDGGACWRESRALGRGIYSGGPVAWGELSASPGGGT